MAHRCITSETPAWCFERTSSVLPRATCPRVSCFLVDQTMYVSHRAATRVAWRPLPMRSRRASFDSENHNHWWLDGDHICFYDTLGGVTRLSQRQIQDEAAEIIRQRPDGIRFMELAREIQRLHPETPPTSIPGALNKVGRTVHA